MCGADFPFKVSALGDAPLMSYADDLRPPATVPGASADMPRWPSNEPRYAPPPRNVPVAPTQNGQMRWMTGPQGIDRSQGGPAGEPMSISPPQGEAQETPMQAAPLPPPSNYQNYPAARPSSYPNSYPRAATRPSDIPEDAVIPQGGSAAVPAPQSQRRYETPQTHQPQTYQPPRLGPTRAIYGGCGRAETGRDACLSDGFCARSLGERRRAAGGAALVQSAGRGDLQLGSYSCRGMVGGSAVS